MPQSILTLREAPFDLTAGAMCSVHEPVLQQWRQNRLCVWHRDLPPPILAFLEKEATAAVMRQLDTISFDVIFEAGQVRLRYQKFSDRIEFPDSIKNKTSFSELFGDDPERMPFVHDVEARARQAADVLQGKYLRVRIRTKVYENARFHIDFGVSLNVAYGNRSTKMLHPGAAEALEYDPTTYAQRFYRCDDSNRVRMLAQGDVCVVGEMPHASPAIADFGEPVRRDRDGPWLGFFSLEVHNPSYAEANLI